MLKPNTKYPILENGKRFIPDKGDVWKHFKGKMYQIKGIVKHTETGEDLMVYQALYGDHTTYARPLEMFMSKTDKDKYPDAEQEYRLEHYYGKDFYPIITIIGYSVKNLDKMYSNIQLLRDKKYDYIIFETRDLVYEKLTDSETFSIAKEKAMQKIDMSDEVIVLAHKKDKLNIVADELIEYAKLLDKEILYLEDIEKGE